MLKLGGFGTKAASGSFANPSTDISYQQIWYLFLKSLHIYRFFPKRICKHHLRKYPQLRKTKVNVRGKAQTEEKAEDAARCRGTESGGNAVSAAGSKALCAKGQAKPWGPPSLQPRRFILRVLKTGSLQEG